MAAFVLAAVASGAAGRVRPGPSAAYTVSGRARAAYRAGNYEAAARLFRRAAFQQGPDRYDYRYHTLRLNHLADADFEAR